MNTQDVVDMQYKVLALADKLNIDRNSKEFKEFKRRIFENVEYLKSLQIDKMRVL